MVISKLEREKAGGLRDHVFSKAAEYKISRHTGALTRASLEMTGIFQLKICHPGLNVRAGISSQPPLTRDPGHLIDSGMTYFI